MSGEEREKLSNFLELDDSGQFLEFIKNLLDKEPFQSHDFFKNLLDEASAKRAYRCVKTLLDIQNEINFLQNFDINSLIKKAAIDADGLMVLLLCGNNIETAAQYLFSNSETQNSPIYFHSLLRYMPIRIVDQLVDSFSKKSSIDLENPYQHAKEQFHSIAPYFARYSKTSDLKVIEQVYNAMSYIGLKENTIKDMAYGEKRKELAEKLNSLLQEKSFNAPQQEQFLTLPPSSTNSRRAAALLEIISTQNAEAFKDRGDIIRGKAFSSLRRATKYETGMSGRYAWGKSLVKAVFTHSPSPEYELFKFDRNSAILNQYPLSYKIGKQTILVNVVQFGNYNSFNKWYHGNALISDTWKSIEDLFERACSLNLIMYVNEDTYEQKLNEFYSIAAELVWLIGNTQPMQRGSGTFAELMLAIIHMQNGLSLPILKLDFPQLDVLDISFPLEDYKYFFPYFFESSTVPAHLAARFEGISSDLSVDDQMEKLYEQFNLKCSLEIEPDEESQQLISDCELTKDDNSASIKVVKDIKGKLAEIKDVDNSSAPVTKIR